MIGTTRLDHHHRSTAEAVLSHPVRHNIEWPDVLSLLEAIGEVSEEHNGKFKVDVGGETRRFTARVGRTSASRWSSTSDACSALWGSPPRGCASD
jgi:hypothetical protein